MNKELCIQCQGKTKQCVHCGGTGFVIKWKESTTQTPPKETNKPTPKIFKKDNSSND